MKKIPSKIRIGGEDIEVRFVERCDDNSIGTAQNATGLIEIADKFSKDSLQSESSKVGTFYHEVVHIILDTMHHKLMSNEAFVCIFAAFLNEAMTNAVFIEKYDNDTLH